MAERRIRKKRILNIILILLGVIIIAGFVIISPKAVGVLKLKSEAESLVAASNRNTFKSTQTTVIYDANGDQLCTMRNTKDMFYVNFSDIPSDVVNAFIVMEDRKFYEHSGIDIKAIVRAIIANQRSDYIEQGASTITQQLARGVFLTQDVNWERKIQEMFVAVELEKIYSKDDILEFYLNNIYFANGYYGVEAAARGYFNKSIGELTLSEQAFLAAIPNNPTKYNPIDNYDNALARRNLILQQMYDNDKINTMNYYSAIEEDIVINQPEKAKNSYVETYVRHCATEAMMESYGFSIRYNFESEEDYNAYQEQYDTYYSMSQQKLLSGGYRIYTSIDLDIQAKLQTSIDDNLAEFTSLSDDGIYEMQGAATCIDNATGNVVAIVGGRSQELSGYTLNRAYQSYRQPGSSIKPLSVYTPYLQLGNTPDTIVVDEPITGGPSNADGTYAGEMTVRDAVKYSKNTVAWKIYTEITPKAGSEFLIKMGFKKVYVDKEYVSGALGGFTYGVTTEEMAGGYAAIANDGVYRKTTCINTIVNPNGKTVVDESGRGVRIYDMNATRMMTDVLKSVVTSGTGKAANIENGIVAGKTGTTNSNKDAWFVGFSRYYTTSVWIGYDMPREMNNPSIYVNTIWSQFMTSLHQNLMIADFPTYVDSNKQEASTRWSEGSSEATTQATSESMSETTPTVQPSTAQSSIVQQSVVQPSTVQQSVVQPSTAQQSTVQYGDVDADISGYGDSNANTNSHGDVSATTNVEVID